MDDKDPFSSVDWTKVIDQGDDLARSSLASAVGQNPDEVAANLSLSKQSGLPVDVVARNRAEVERKQALDSLDFDHILSESPEAKKWMEDRHNAALIIDEPTMIGAIKRNMKDIPRSFSQGVDRNQLIDLRFKQIMGQSLSPEESASMQALSDSMEGKQFGTGGLASKAVQTTVNFAPQMGMQFLRSGEGAVAGGAVGAGVGAGVGALAGGVGAAPGAVAGFGTGAKIGWGLGSLYENFRQMSALTLDDISRIKDENGNKIDPDVARGASIAVGLASAPLDAYALGKLAAITPGVSQVQQFLTKQGIRQALMNGGMREAFMQIGKKFAAGITADAIAGAAQQGFQILGEEYAKQHSDGNFSPITGEEAGQRILEGAGTNAMIAGTLGFANAPIEAYRVSRHTFTPDEVAAHVQNINNMVRDPNNPDGGKLFQRSPERFHDLVSRLAQDDRFYVNPEAAERAISALEPAQRDALFNAVPDLRTELETALTSGADVAIKKADYATFIAPFPQADLLRDHIKLDPADTSVAERAVQTEFLKSNPEAAADIQKQIGQLPKDASYQEMVPAIERIVRKAMIDGGMTPDEARSNAALFARTQARFAAPFGQSGIDAINRGLIEFNTVDEQGRPIKSGSNFSVLLNDLARLNKGERIPGADDNMIQAIRDFGTRINEAGITPEKAASMSSRELLDLIYPVTLQQELDLGDMGTVTLPELSQNPDGTISAKEPDHNGIVLKQSYAKEPVEAKVDDALKDAPQTPYNGTDSPEFKAAVVPKDAPKRVFDALKKHGVEVKTYDRSVEGSRLEAIKSFGKSVLFQKERGSITFMASNDFARRLRDVTVAFTQSKNFSTGAHEFSHWAVAQHRMFAEMARARIADGDTNPEIKRIADDWETLKSKVGAKSDRFTVEQEEHIAKLFESYMREGNAPSEALRRIFTRFRDWLTKIYKDQKSLGVEMSDDIRGVFDRWLASEEEIQTVKDKNGALAEIARNLGLDANISERVADYVNSATSHAEEQLYRKLSAEQKRRESKAYQEELETMKVKVSEEMAQKREYNLTSYLKTNKFKMLEGPETDGVDPELLSSEHGEGVVHPDDIADLYGYESGMDMLRSLKAVKPFDEAVNSEARKRLLAKYPDMIAQGRLHVEALDAIVNDRVLLAIDLMIRELGKSRGKNTVGMKQFAMAMAQQQVEKMKMSEANYTFRFDAGRDKEMRSALQESRAGNSDKAMLHLQRSMVNQIIYKHLEAFKDLRQKAGEMFDRVDALDKELAPTKDMDFIGAARYILHKFGLGGAGFDINQWIADIQERDPDVMNDLIGLSTMIDAPQKSAKDLTISEFKDIYNSIKNIYATARSMKEFEIAGKKMRTDQAVAELIAKMGPPTKPLNDGTQIIGANKFRNAISSAKAALRRVELWAHAMDGGDQGPFTKYIWRVASEAEDSYKIDREKWLSGYRDILVQNKDLLTQKGKIATDMEKTNSVGQRSRLVFNDRLELIGFLLHTGNESNLDKLLGGYGIERQRFNDEISRLEDIGVITERDWKLTQQLWDYMEAIKPMTQQAFKKLYGYRFDEIENAPVRTKYGVFRGGYWPAIADHDQAINNKSVQEALENNRQYMLATTAKGFTKSRVSGYRQPLKTDLRLGSQHIDKVLRFVHLEPATRDIARILNRNEFKALLKAHDFDAFDGMLMPWLQRFSQQTTEPRFEAGDRSGDMGRKIINFMRSAAVSQIIRYNVVTALQNIANMPVAAHLVGMPELMRSFASVTVNPLGSIKEVKSASKMMQERLSINGIKIAQQINQIAERRGVLSRGRDVMLRHGTVFMHAIDSYLGTITWHAAYNDGLKKGLGDADSIAHADSVARQVMGSTGAKDVSKIEASHPVVKAIMPFYSYFNTQANLVGTEFGNIMRAHGWKGSGKMFMAYISLIAAPAIIGDFIVQGLRGQLPNSDEDGNDPLTDWMSWATESQLKYMGAMVPFASQGVAAILNVAHDRPADDRISASPAFSAVTTAIRTGGEIAKEASEDGDVRDSRLIRDVMSSFGFVFNVPLGQVAKPISYIVDVEEGETQPDGPLDYMRGLVVGPPPKK